MQNLIIGIHDSLNRSFPKMLSYYVKILEYNNLECLRLSVSESDFWEKLSKISYFIFRWGHRDSDSQMARIIMPIIENVFEIKCFPSQATCWHYDDKIRQHYLLNSYRFPIVKTWVFWDKISALKFIETASFPLVFKLKGGAGSSNVVLIEKWRHANKLINKMFSKGIVSYEIPIPNNLSYLRNVIKLYGLRRYIAFKRGRLGPDSIKPYWQIHRDYVLFQEFLPGNKFDVRITIIGNRAFAFVRYVRPHDFRASGSGNIDYDVNKIDMRCIEIAFDISEKMKFQSMCYDFIFDQNKNPKIAEISYTFVDSAVYNCPGYFDKELNWHEGHYWPQFCHLSDLIQEKTLEQPPVELMSI